MLVTAATAATATFAVLFQVVRLLLEHEAEVNAADAAEWTPLMHAVDRGHLQIAELLVRRTEYEYGILRTIVAVLLLTSP